LNLTKNKAYKVRAIYRNTQSLEKIRQLFVKHSDSGATQFDTIEWIQADLSNIPALEKAFEGVTFVFHCAGLISFQPQDFDKLIEVNVQGTANIVNLSIDFGVKKLCYVSSVATLSTLPHTPIDEENDWNNEDNNTDYAISKHGAEMEVWRGSQEGLPVVIVNPSVVLGGDFADRCSGLLYKKVADGLCYYPAGATGFVGVGSDPIPLSDEEASDLLAKIGVETSGSESRFNIDFKEGDRVVVKKDSFYDQTGEISSIDYEHGRVTVMLEVFGRLTPVELEYNEVEKSEY